MHIKQVNLSGFRSYRENTSIEAFSARHNVVVGRNGSGKSNFFLAIQFVLAEEWAHLKTEQRTSLLHESSGPKTLTARVEIVFDNSDRRIPAVESNEVRIVRQVGQKKDQYLIDGKMVPRSEVVNLMESAGFSRSNPYYIVKQGKINELATAPDAYRLKLLREVAGTRVYDERKEESLKILKETQTRTQKIESVLSFIEERLETLGEEKKELSEYQKWDRAKRSIEHTLYETQITEAQRRLDDWQREREKIAAQQNQFAKELVDEQARQNDLQAQRRHVDNRLRAVRDDHDQLLADQNECAARRKELELRASDVREELEAARQRSATASADSATLEKDVESTSQQRDHARQAFQDASTAESKADTELRIARARLDELLARRAQGQQFQSVEARNRAINDRLRFISRQIAETEQQKERIEEERRQMETECESAERERKNLEHELRECSTRSESLALEQTRRKEALGQAMAAQLKSARDEKEARDRLDERKEELARLEGQRHGLMPKSVANGVASVQKVLSEWRDKAASGRSSSQNAQHDLDGYRGILIDLFSCRSNVYAAVENTAGGRLFYHVVDDDKLALKILKEVNARNLPGELNFFPLNRTNAPQLRPLQNTKDAALLIDHVECDERYDDLMRSVFGGTALVRSLEVGARIAHEEGFNCVTPDGDRVDRRGPVTGGYNDVKSSRIDAYVRVKTARAELAEEQRRVDEAALEVQRLQRDLDEARAKLGHVEADAKMASQRYSQLNDRLHTLVDQLRQTRRQMEPQELELLARQNRLEELQAEKAHVAESLDAPDLHSSQMTGDEQNKCHELEDEIERRQAEARSLVEKRTRAERELGQLETKLQRLLLSRQQVSRQNVSSVEVNELRHNQEGTDAELRSLLMRQKDLLAQQQHVDDEMDRCKREAHDLARQVDEAQQAVREREEEVARLARQADTLCQRQSVEQNKKEEAMRKIRELGSLPADAHDRYRGMSAKQLDRKLTECVDELKKYEHVNKKAFDQFSQADQQKVELTARMAEQKKSERSIEELLDVLETRKYEAIQLTFKQVSKNFRDVFEKLVPGGRGELVMQMAGTGDSQDGLAELAADAHAIDKFVGVGIKVSFTGGGDTREMQQLSGGQKSLVALALIFSIQKCDPAPFYLFDEIDAALDAQHRKAVGDMIHELSDGAQFITTTFRPELLASAEKYYGVHFKNKISHIDVVTKEQALDFVEDDQAHG